MPDSREETLTPPSPGAPAPDTGASDTPASATPATDARVSAEAAADATGESPLERCERRLGYRFRDRGLLVASLTHASGADSRLVSNERMEFLGDAILGWVVCEQLYHRFPDYLEGDLTKLKSVVVSRRTCAKLSRKLGMEEFLILGKGMTTTPGVPMSVLADVFESLIAAIYLDGGRDEVAAFVREHAAEEIELAAASASAGNYKSALQQLAQREHGVTPTYHLLDEKGPDHNKCFQVCAQIGAQRFEPAWGASKKESEQRAARNALAVLEAPDDQRADSPTDG